MFKVRLTMHYANYTDLLIALYVFALGYYVDHPYSIETALMYVCLGNNLNDDTFVFALIWFITHCVSVI